MNLPSREELRLLLEALTLDDPVVIEAWTARTGALLVVDQASPVPLLWESVRRGGVRAVPFLVRQGRDAHEVHDGQSLVEAVVNHGLHQQRMPVEKVQAAITALLDAGSVFRLCPGWSAATLGLLSGEAREINPGRAWTVLDAVMNHPAGWQPTRSHAVQAWQDWVGVLVEARERELLTYPFEPDWFKSATGSRWCTTLFKACPLAALIENDRAWSDVVHQGRGLRGLIDTVRIGAERAELALGLQEASPQAATPDRRRL